MKHLVIYVHGKGGCSEEAEHYKSFFTESDVIGFDYQSQNVWEAQNEFPSFFDSKKKEYDSITLIANSIGAFFSMSTLSEKQIDKALFISPIVNMEKLIQDMMIWANITEDELRVKKEIPTKFGETLTWDYLCYVHKHPIKWHIPTYILYGERDNLTSIETISTFADRIDAQLTIMKGGEHWFHTEKQMEFLDSWVKESIG